MSLWLSYTVYENPHPVTIAELHRLPPSHLLFSAYSRFVIYLWILSPSPSSAVYLLYQRKTAQFTQINPFCIKMVIDLLTNTTLSQPQLCIAKSWKLQGYRLHNLPWQHASLVLHAVTFFFVLFLRSIQPPKPPAVSTPWYVLWCLLRRVGNLYLWNTPSTDAGPAVHQRR